MADHTPPPANDPDFPVDPHEAAQLQAQLQQAASNLHDELWNAMKELLRTADLLYINLWRQPALNSLPAALEELTGLTRADTDALYKVTDRLAFVTELTLRCARLYLFIAVARHLLDTRLGVFVLQLHLTPHTQRQAREEDFTQLRASYVGLFEQALRQLHARASDELPELNWPLLHAQLADLVTHANAQPNLFFNATPGTDPAPWPPPPPEGEEVKEYVSPAHCLPFLRLGAATLLMVAYKLTSAWAQALLALLPTARVAYLNSLQDTREPELNEHGSTFHLTLTTATELHLIAHLSGLLATSATWDELAAVTFGKVLAKQDALLASQLPPGVSLPAPEPGDASLKSSVGLAAAAVIEQLEALFGADAAPLAANRERIAHMIDLA